MEVVFIASTGEGEEGDHRVSLQHPWGGPKGRRKKGLLMGGRVNREGRMTGGGNGQGAVAGGLRKITNILW